MKRLAGPLLTLIVGAALVAGCGTAPSPSPSPSPAAVLELTLLAGPTCPVETVPPDPNCAPVPVAGRVVLVLAPDGREVARGTSDAAGHIRIAVAPGSYVLRAAPVDGFPTAPADVPVVVPAGAPLQVTLEFDTGIR
jgi:hypothetical protein